MNITRIFWTAALAVLFLISCEKDKQFDKAQSKSDIDKKTIIVGGKALYAGYGYDPVEDRAFRNAIHPDAVFESTDIQPALSVQISKVTKLKELEEHAHTTYSVNRKKSRFLGLMKSSYNIMRTLETYVKINEESVTVIAKVKAQHQRFYTNAEPQLIPPAKRLLEQKKYSQFLDNYGHFYVSDRTVGGEVQYVYHFSYCKIDRWSRGTFVEKAKKRVLGIFGKNSGADLSMEDQMLLEHAQESVHMLSSVPGYAPRMVHTIEDANSETARLQAYLQAHPEKATTIKMELKPYSELIEDEDFNRMSFFEETYLEKVKSYKLFLERSHFVYQNASSAKVREKAYNDIQAINFILKERGRYIPPIDLDAKYHKDYRNLKLGQPCGNYSSDFRIQLKLGDRDLGANAGPVQSTVLANEWSHWAGDSNGTDPDWIQVGLALDANLPMKLIDKDFRLAIQIADDMGSSQHGTVMYTPWASEGGGWSEWANDTNDYNFDMVRVRLETRYKKDFMVNDMRIGIQSLDKNRSHPAFTPLKRPITSEEMFTPWMKQGGGWSGYAGRNYFGGMDRVRIRLDVRF